MHVMGPAYISQDGMAEAMQYVQEQKIEINVEVRRAKRSDYEQILALLSNLDETDKKFLALSPKLSVVKQNIRNERHCYVAECEGEIVGFLRESGRPHGYSLLEELVVTPEYRNRGIGSLLLDSYHKDFSFNLAKTNAKNISMIHLLEKNGYVAEDRKAPRIINWERT